MKVNRLVGATSVTLILLMLLAAPSLAVTQKPASLLATAPGQGTLVVGKEEFKVSYVVVKLKEDGTGEITVVTDLQLFVTCTWSAPEELSSGIDLKITGGTNLGTAQGSGKVFLRPDGKSIASMSLDGISTASKRKFLLKFVAD